MRTAARLVLLGCVTFIGCRDDGAPHGSYPRVDAGDPSILLDVPFPTTTGKFNHNGTAFDRAEIDLADVEVVWVPQRADLSEAGAPPGRVVIDLEKRLFDGSHTTEGTDIHQARKKTEVRVARTAGAVIVVVNGGWNHRHGGMEVSARFHIPRGVRVERGEPPRAEGAAPLSWEVAPQTPVPVPETRR